MKVVLKMHAEKTQDAFDVEEYNRMTPEERRDALEKAITQFKKSVNAELGWPEIFEVTMEVVD